MNSYYNIPRHSAKAQRLIDRFNCDEAHWRSLENRRKLRRKLLKELTEKEHTQLVLMEFAVSPFLLHPDTRYSSLVTRHS
jgi:hypothetical protein